MHVYLSKEESRQLVAFGAKVINGRARVIVQTSALLVDEVVEGTRHAAECGADGVMVLPPFFEGPTDDQGIVDFYSTVSEAGLYIIGCNVPQAVGVGVPPDLFRSEEHTSELQSLMRISYAVFCLTKKNTLNNIKYKS